jgi:hypothetical protein
MMSSSILLGLPNFKRCKFMITHFRKQEKNYSCFNSTSKIQKAPIVGPSPISENLLEWSVSRALEITIWPLQFIRIQTLNFIFFKVCWWFSTFKRENLLWTTIQVSFFVASSNCNVSGLFERSITTRAIRLVSEF